MGYSRDISCINSIYSGLAFYSEGNFSNQFFVAFSTVAIIHYHRDRVVKNAGTERVRVSSRANELIGMSE
jgi:hypothetical protein